MPSFQTSRVLLLAAALSLAGCGEGDAQPGSAQAGAEPSAAVAAPAGNGGTAGTGAGGDRFTATVSTAPFAGRHEASGAMTCMMFNGLWQAVHENQREEGLSGMLLQVKEVPATGGSSDRVSLSLTFGQMDDMSGRGGLLDVHGAEFGGDARATITREGSGAVIRIEGTAQSRAAVAAELRCASVDFMR